MSASAGWYPNPGGLPGQRYFDGTEWTDHYTRELSSEQRTARLDEVVDQWMSQGGRLESRTPFQAAIVFGTPANDLVHLILALFTCGLWLIVWLMISSSSQRPQRRILRVDPYGFVRELDAFGNEIVALGDPNP